MNQRGKLDLLVAAHPFLTGLKPSVCELFSQCASLHRFAEGKEIFHEGGGADHFYLLRSGQVVLEVFAPGHGMVAIQAVGPGEALGWSWLFPPHQWHFSARVTQPTELIAFGAECLRQKARQDHDFCYELVVRLGQVLAGRLEEVRTRLIYNYQRQP